jgi:hypothetical protein
VELHRPDVVQVTGQRKEALLCLVVPYFYLVIIASGDEERLSLVKIDSAHRP